MYRIKALVSDLPRGTGCVLSMTGNCSPFALEGADELRYLGRMETKPTHYSQCDKTRKCPWVSCRYHLGVTVYVKAVREHTVTRTCALEVAEKGEHSLREIGEIMGITKEAVRLGYVSALQKLNRSLAVP